MSDALRWVEVVTYGAVFQADMAVAMLEEAGIPARVGGGEHVGIFGAGFQGWTNRGVPVLVPQHRAEEARELLEETPAEDEDGDE
jgi:hypothetical protein